VGPAIEERRTLVRSKLANEPSVASLMGVPPIVEKDRASLDVEKAPPTVVDAPPTTTMTAAGPTPRMGGADAASLTAPPKTPESPGAPRRPATQPSRIADPAVRPIAQGIPAETLRDAPPTEPMPPPTTLMSAEPMRSDPAMLDVHEASVRSFSGSVAPE